MVEIPKVNGKNWLAKGLLQVIIVLAFLAYVAVKEMSPGNGKENERIARLEEVIITLRPLPMDMAGVKVSIENLKSSVDELKKKIDYIDKGK